jgi:hypothetical protein
MRALPCLLALLMVASALPLAKAQAAPEVDTPQPPVQVLDDPAGDQVATAGGTSAGNPDGRYAASDLLSLNVEELKDALVLHLGVSSLTVNPEAPFVESTLYQTDFSYGGMVYRAQFFRNVLAPGQVQYSGSAYVYDPTRGAFDRLEQLVVSADTASNTLVATLPRSIVLDQNGGAPFPGRTLEAWHVHSYSVFTQGRNIQFGPVPIGGQNLPQVDVTDNMPNDGPGQVPFPIKLGLAQDGNARLYAEVPYRASNGEATTMVFQVNATNLGPTQRFALAAVGQPATWQVDLPSDIIELGANKTTPFPVLVSMPFAHAHGTVSSFVVTMTGLDHPSDVGRVQLGVRFTQPPQPAGHHNLLYLHTQAPEGDQTLSAPFQTAFGFDAANLYFNTLTPDEDTNDAKTPVGGQSFFYTQTVPPMQSYHWTVPLSPTLQMGLDFDESRQGNMKVSVNTVLPMNGAHMSGRMVYTMPDPAARCNQRGLQGNGCSYDDAVFGPGQHLTVATLMPSAGQDVAAETTNALFEMPIVPTKDGDYVLFHRDATLALELNLTFLRADGFVGPKDLPKISGGELDDMPLNEYHDPVTQVFTSISSLMIIVQGEQQRLVNPGKTALYDLTLMNHDKDSHTYQLSMTGPGMSWAQILGDKTLTVPAGKTVQLGIAVTAPATAVDGDKSDIVLAAANSKDPSERTLARLLTMVDTKAPHPDDSGMVPGLAAKLTKKKSPGVEPVLLLGSLALLAVALRRRRWG